MMGRVGLFAGVCAAVGVALVVPAALIGGQPALVRSLAALGLTALPTLATLAWAGWAFRSAPDLVLVAGLGGSVVRMALALGGGLALVAVDGELFGAPFWIWLAVFYLIFLALEITLLVRGPAAPAGPAGEGTPKL